MKSGNDVETGRAAAASRGHSTASQARPSTRPVSVMGGPERFRLPEGCFSDASWCPHLAKPSPDQAVTEGAVGTPERSALAHPPVTWEVTRARAWPRRGPQRRPTLPTPVKADTRHLQPGLVPAR